VGKNQKDDGGTVADPKQPWDGPDYVFVRAVETNEQRRREIEPEQIPPSDFAVRPFRTEKDLKHECEALAAIWKKNDPFQQDLTWYALKQGLALADAKTFEVKRFTELLGERDFVPSSIAFGKDKVWLGTNKGLFAWDRKDMFWTRFAVGGTMIDAPVKEVSLTEDGTLRVTTEGEAKATRKFEYDTANSKWTEVR
jgi:hypothetical protein